MLPGPKALERAIELMKNLRKAAEAGDLEAIYLLRLAEAGNPAFVAADLSKYRTPHDRPK